eukprot:PITA_24006
MWGGWGLKDLPTFAKALAVKMGWSLLTSQNLWARLSYHKYIWPQNILDWDWKDYCAALSESHIIIRDGTDELVWSQADNGIYSPKVSYIALSEHKKPDHIPSWSHDIWKLTAPPRAKLFFWCVLRDRIPTGDHLMRRSIHGPSWCVMCKAESESTEHLFLRCSTSRELWRSLSHLLTFSGIWEGANLTEAWEN